MTPSTRLALAQPGNYPLYLGDIKSIGSTILISISPRRSGIYPGYNPLFTVVSLNVIDSWLYFGIKSDILSS